MECQVGLHYREMENNKGESCDYSQSVTQSVIAETCQSPRDKPHRALLLAGRSELGLIVWNSRRKGTMCQNHKAQRFH